MGFSFFRSSDCRSTDFRTSEAGVSLIELAISSPLIILIAVGIANYGFLLREIQAIADIAKQGARHAAAYNATAPGGSCSSGANSVAAVAERAVQEAMAINGIDSAVYDVTAQVSQSGSTIRLLTDAAQPYDRLQLIEVELQRKPDAPACFVCSALYFNMNTGPHARSTFALEGDIPCT